MYNIDSYEIKVQHLYSILKNSDNKRHNPVALYHSKYTTCFAFRDAAYGLLIIVDIL